MDGDGWGLDQASRVEGDGASVTVVLSCHCFHSKIHLISTECGEVSFDPASYGASNGLLCIFSYRNVHARFFNILRTPPLELPVAEQVSPFLIQPMIVFFVNENKQLWTRWLQ